MSQSKHVHRIQEESSEQVSQESSLFPTKLECMYWLQKYHRTETDEQNTKKAFLEAHIPIILLMNSFTDIKFLLKNSLGIASECGWNRGLCHQLIDKCLKIESLRNNISMDEKLQLSHVHPHLVSRKLEFVIKRQLRLPVDDN